MLRSLLIGLAVAGIIAGGVHAAPLQIMSFNVENLFDTEDDPENPRDDTYLPLSVKQGMATHEATCRQFNTNFFLEQCLTLDWSEATYNTKVQRIGGVLLGIGRLPDVLVMPETENRKVIDDLLGALLGHAYQSIVALDSSDKPDNRGIDVAIVSTLPLVGTPVAHKVAFGSHAEVCGATRDIVEATFALPDEAQLTVLGVHLPSQGNPVECRIRAFQQLSNIRRSKGDSALVIAAGDFNFDCTELASPLHERLVMSGGWYIPPTVRAGCNAPGSSKFFDNLLSWNTWSYLDHVLISPGLSPTQASDLNWFADLGSFQTVVVHPEQVAIDRNDRGFVEPRRFDPLTGRGVSDHWPVLVRLLNRRSN